jgi:heat shock protein HtpX
MPTLYAHKESNIRKTWILFTLFLLIVIGLGYFFSAYFQSSGILIFAVFFSVLMSAVSYWHSDKIVLKMSGARPVSREHARELYNIVENLAITAGLPIPKIYIINDPSPNAFATGRNPKKAIVAVTTGLMEILDRSELEGVVAHELSHIGNWDMLISTMAVVMVGFISLASDFFLRSFFWGGRSGDNDRHGGNTIVLLLAIAFAILAPLAAILMQLAISRKREFLADASGALLTRYPEGLANALKKISKAPAVKSASNTTAHLWFDDPFGPRSKTPWWHKIFMTHPPVEERIKALMP